MKTAAMGGGEISENEAQEEAQYRAPYSPHAAEDPVSVIQMLIVGKCP